MAEPIIGECCHESERAAGLKHTYIQQSNHGDVADLSKTTCHVYGKTQSKRDEKCVKSKIKFADSMQVKLSSVNAIYNFIKLLSPQLDFCRNRVQ